MLPLWYLVSKRCGMGVKVWAGNPLRHVATFLLFLRSSPHRPPLLSQRSLHSAASQRHWGAVMPSGAAPPLPKPAFYFRWPCCCCRRLVYRCSTVFFVFLFPWNGTLVNMFCCKCFSHTKSKQFYQKRECKFEGAGIVSML